MLAHALAANYVEPLDHVSRRGPSVCCWEAGADVAHGARSLLVMEKTQIAG